MAIDISRDLLGLNQTLAQTRAELKNNKAELSAVNKAMRDNADNAELQRIKQDLLAQQLQLTKEQISALSSAQDKLNTSHEKGDAAATVYDSALKQLNISSIGLQGQIEKMTQATDKDTQANERNSVSLVRRIQTIRQVLSGLSAGINLTQSMVRYIKDWNAVNEDGTPKMDAFAKSMAVLNTIMTAATIIGAFAKAYQTFGPLVGTAIAVGAVATFTGVLASFIASGGLNNAGNSKQQSQTQAYGGGGGYVGYGNVVGGGGVSSYSEKTINYNMNINANKYGAEFANNPAVIKPIVSALNQELGTKIK